MNKIEDKEEFLELITLKKNDHEKKDARFTKYLQITVNIARYAFICDVRENKRQQYHNTRES